MSNPATIPLMNQKVNNHTSITPLDAIRTETVLSRLPIHNLAKRGNVDIHITKKNEHGEVELNWKVIPNLTIGEPRALAYKLDTIVINRRIHEAPRPIPELIYLGSLRDIARELNLGNDTPAVKKALSQNAAAMLIVKLKYVDKDGLEQVAAFEQTRYGVAFMGQKLPNGSKADGVYLILNAAYRQVLNTAPVRPLDYQYLKELPPAAQRFYELVSYKIFAAIKFKHPRAKLPYSEYCTFSAQQRYYDFDHVKKQMYKVHKPHLASGYLSKAIFDATVDSDGKSDWVMSYAPGPKARAEFKAFNRRHAEIADALDEESVLPLETTEASAPDDAHELVSYFHRRFHQSDTPTPTPAERKFAAALIAQHGTEASRRIVDYSLEAAARTNFSPKMLVGIRQYVDDAVATFRSQAKKREKTRHEESARLRDEQLKAKYEDYRNQQITLIKAAMPPQELTDLESAIREDLTATGSVYHRSELMINIAIDKQLATRAGVLPYEDWLSQQSSS